MMLIGPLAILTATSSETVLAAELLCRRGSRFHKIDMRSFSNNKEISELVRLEVKLGAAFTKGRKHGKLRLSNGRLIIVPCSPSDFRAEKNFKCELMRRKKI